MRKPLLVLLLVTVAVIAAFTQSSFASYPHSPTESTLSSAVIPGSVGVKSFPVGLILQYRVNSSLEIEGDWINRYDVLCWAPEVKESVLQIYYSTKYLGHTSNTTYYVEVPTWSYVNENGSYTGVSMGWPLWENITGWRDGQTIEIPSGADATVRDSYELSTETWDLPTGRYLCWRAHRNFTMWGDEINFYLYFEKQLGVRVRSVRTQESFDPYPSMYVHVLELEVTNLSAFFPSTTYYLTLGVIGVLALIVIVVFLLIRRRVGKGEPGA